MLICVFIFDRKWHILQPSCVIHGTPETDGHWDNKKNNEQGSREKYNSFVCLGLKHNHTGFNQCYSEVDNVSFKQCCTYLDRWSVIKQGHHALFKQKPWPPLVRVGPRIVERTWFKTLFISQKVILCCFIFSWNNRISKCKLHSSKASVIKSVESGQRLPFTSCVIISRSAVE